MIKLSILPEGPGTVASADFQALADEFKAIDSTVQTEFLARPRIGYGVTWWEPLTIYLETHAAGWAAEAAATLLIESVCRRVTSWVRRRRQKRGARRPFAFTLLDAEGKVLAAFDIPPGEDAAIISVERSAGAKLSDYKRSAKLLTKRLEGEARQQEVLYAVTESKDKSRSTIIYCDIPDSTSILRKAYPVSHREWLDQCRDNWSAVIEDAGGVVFHSYRDTLGAYFRDADCKGRAAQCAAGAALAIREATETIASHRLLTKLRVRVGLATATLAPRQLRIRGPKFNRTEILAAALSHSATNDAIAVDVATHKLLTNEFELTPRAVMSLPQRRAPVRSYRLVGPRQT